MLNSFYDRFIFTNSLEYKHNNFFLLNVPFVIAPSTVLSGIAKIPDPVLQKKVYYAVKSEIKENLVAQLGKDFVLKRDKMLEFLFAFFTASGWGLFETRDINSEQKRALVVVKNSPFSRFFPHNSAQAVDSFLRGIIAGTFCVVFSENIDCVETSCSAMGAGLCSFVVKPLYDFDFDGQDVRNQLDPE